MIPSLGKFDAGFVRQLSRHQRAKGRPGVDPGSNRGAADGELPEVPEGVAEMGDAVRDLAGVSAKRLPKANRCRIHEMGASYLQDIPELL